MWKKHYTQCLYAHTQCTGSECDKEGSTLIGPLGYLNRQLLFEVTIRISGPSPGGPR